MSGATRSTRLGIGLVAIALLGPAARWTIVASTNWTPVEIPLSAAAGAAAVRDFTVDAAGKYELALKIDRPRDRDASRTAECLLGFDWPGCADIDSVVALRWTLRAEDGRSPECAGNDAGEGAATARSLSGSLSDRHVDRWLGCADLRPGLRYRLHVESAVDTAALQPYTPRVVVQPSATLSRDEAGETAAIWLLSLLTALCGAALLL